VRMRDAEPPGREREAVVGRTSTIREVGRGSDKRGALRCVRQSSGGPAQGRQGPPEAQAFSSGWQDFRDKLDKIHPRFGDTTMLPFDEPDDSGAGL
jgi:hypothetical protein